LQIQPGAEIGQPATVQSNPKTSFIEIQNSSVTSSDTLIPPLSVTRRHGEDILRVAGRITPGSSPRKFPISVCQPEYYFLHLLRERLAEFGVAITGEDRIDSSHGTTLLGSVSHPIDSVIHLINKPSDNIAAENMMKTIAAERFAAPGSTERGLTVVKEYLASLSIDTARMHLADGSGVSWYNMISPDAVVQLLEEQFKDKQTFQHFYESLPIAGVDGTLKGRMIGTRAENNVRGKTGSLTGESCISGYATTMDGKMLAFGIFCNHSPGEISYLRSVQDRILELLANYDTRHP